MKTIQLVLSVTFLAIVSCDLPTSKRPLVFPNWPPHAQKLQSPANSVKRNGQRTLVVQFRSDSRAPFVIKRSPPHMIHSQPLMSRPRPQKLSFKPHHVHMLKAGPVSKPLVRKPSSILKIKLPSVKPQAMHYEKPSIIYEKPHVHAYETQKLPMENTIHFIDAHYAPIQTIPAPNLGLHDNHIFHDDALITPMPYTSYQVTEDGTNDHTIIDVTGHHKFFAPDPDPSLPTSKIRPAIDPFSIPSNGKPLPFDVQSNYLPPLPVHPQTHYLPPSNPQNQYLPPVKTQSHIVSVHQLPLTYSGPLDNKPQLQQYLSQQAAATAPRAPLSLYNPTYLVAQSNNLFKQHQQQLFKPTTTNFLTTVYANADMTQEVASNGQILQSAKDHGVHPQYTSTDDSSAPTFAALIATPPSGPEFASIEDFSSSDGGFVVSNHFGTNPQTITQYSSPIPIVQQHSSEEAALEEANLELQRQIYKHSSTPIVIDKSSIAAPKSAYEEHKRLLEKHLGPISPLRIFVPDEEYSNSGARITKRSDNVYKKGEVEDDNSKEGTFSVSSSVEVSSRNSEEDEQ